MTSIGDFAFESTGLKSVICLAKNVPSTGYFIFRYVPTSSATLYVPESSIDAYKSTSPWSSFGTILAIKDDPTYIVGDANGNGEIEIGDVTTILTIMARGE